MKKKIIIGQSNKNLLIVLLCLMVFVLINLASIWHFESFESWFFETYGRRNRKMVFVFHMLFFVMCGLCGLYIIFRIIKGDMELIISEEGMMLHTYFPKIGWVHWDDITDITCRKISTFPNGFEIRGINSLYYLTIIVNNPEHYVKQQRNYIGKLLLKISWKMFGSPIHITATSIEISFQDLYETVYAAFLRHSEKLTEEEIHEKIEALEKVS